MFLGFSLTASGDAEMFINKHSKKKSLLIMEYSRTSIKWPPLGIGFVAAYCIEVAAKWR